MNFEFTGLLSWLREMLTNFVFWTYFLFGGFFFIGLTDRFNLRIQKWLASFVYLAIYAVIRFLWKHYRIVLPFYRPKEGRRKQMMNACGSGATVSFVFGSLSIVNDVFVRKSTCSGLSVVLLVPLVVCVGAVLILGAIKHGDDQRTIDDDVEDIEMPQWPPN